MDILKQTLTTAPALVHIEYGPKGGLIILAADASLARWGAVLMQEDEEKKHHPARYESGQWNPAERGYDVTKHEYRQS